MTGGWRTEQKLQAGIVKNEEKPMFAILSLDPRACSVIEAIPIRVDEAHLLISVNLSNQSYEKLDVPAHQAVPSESGTATASRAPRLDER